MTIYTGNGDQGYTGLLNFEKRVSKSSYVFEVLGSLDELNASLGYLSQSHVSTIKDLILDIQKDLFKLGGVIADTNNQVIDLSYWEKKVRYIEQEIDVYDQNLPELSHFIFPGGSYEACHLHRARTICRRLERRLVKYVQSTDKKHLGSFIFYLNRLSDYLFVLARYANYLLGYNDILQ